MASSKGRQLGLKDFLAIPPPARPPQSVTEQIAAAKLASAILAPIIGAKRKAEGKD